MIDPNAQWCLETHVPDFVVDELEAPFVLDGTSGLMCEPCSRPSALFRRWLERRSWAEGGAFTGGLQEMARKDATLCSSCR